MVPLNVGDRNIDIGTSGWADRSSTATKARSSTAPPAANPDRLLGEPERQAGQTERAERGAAQIETPGRLGVAALGHMGPSHRHHGDAERQVEQEDPAPRGGVDEPAAEERTDGGGDTAEAGPRADRPAALAGFERGLEDRQAARREQRRADSLDDPGGDQRVHVRGDRTGDRGRGEHSGADEEDPPPPVPVAQGAAEEDQRGERQRVAVDDPLQVGERRIEVLGDTRQGEVDDGAVEQRHARTEHRGEEHPPTGRLADAQAGRVDQKRHRVARVANSSSRSMTAKARSGTTTMIRF